MNGEVSVSSGRSFRVVSDPAEARVTRTFASELEHALERFALDAGFNEHRPVGISFRRGIFGHHQVGRAADIYGVGGVGIDEWRRRWEHARDPRRNLGWRLYKAIQIHGRWSQPYGYPIQLFGPWTRAEGPWKYISDRMLRAHLDHIHVAK